MKVKKISILFLSCGIITALIIIGGFYKFSKQKQKLYKIKSSIKTDPFYGLAGALKEFGEKFNKESLIKEISKRIEHGMERDTVFFDSWDKIATEIQEKYEKYNEKSKDTAFRDEFYEVGYDYFYSYLGFLIAERQKNEYEKKLKEICDKIDKLNK